MPKGSAELVTARKEEIMNACEQLYAERNFKEITLKEIGTITSFTRTSIYNYFQSKEEIFLALFEREYRLWTDDLLKICEEEKLKQGELAEKIAKTLSKRQLMLKILSVNLYDMEENSRMELLVEFKKVYNGSMKALEQIFEKFHAKLNKTYRKTLVINIMQFMYGIYPYAFRTNKQIKAMKLAGIKIKDISIYELALSGLDKLIPTDW